MEASVYETICLVKSHSQDAAANAGKLSLLPFMPSVPLASVVHLHRKREYTCHILLWGIFS